MNIRFQRITQQEQIDNLTLEQTISCDIPQLDIFVSYKDFKFAMALLEAAKPLLSMNQTSTPTVVQPPNKKALSTVFSKEKVNGVFFCVVNSRS